ncbi:MAG: hypothetical protein KKG47_14325 [Proteobacteria bacterium]|nr:hypothetical protein [Pseudomonadota bacterium]MBU1738342.1 hypothetical protein [Pseudomonadota bacterium]
MTKSLFVAFSSVLLCSSIAQAGNFTLGFNDYSLQASLSQVVSQDDRGRSVLRVDGLYNDREDSKLFSAALEVSGPLGNTGLELGAGIKGYYVKINKLDIAAGGLGALAAFTPPGVPKLKFAGNVYYCPKVFTSLDGDRMLSSGVTASYEIASRAVVFLGYTDTRADMENNQEWKIDRGFRGGLALEF